MLHVACNGRFDSRRILGYAATQQYFVAQVETEREEQA